MFVTKKSRKEREAENLPILAEIVKYDDPAQIPSKILATRFGVSQPRIAALIRAAHNSPNTWERLKKAYGYTEAKRKSWVGKGEDEQAAHVYPSIAQRATPAQEFKVAPTYTGIEAVNNTAYARIEPQAYEPTHDIPESSGVLTPEVSYYPVPSNNDKPIRQFSGGIEIVNTDPQPQEEERNPIIFPVSPLRNLRILKIQDTYEEVQYQEGMYLLEQMRDFYADQRAEHESTKKHKAKEKSSSLLKEVLQLIKADKEQAERERNQMLYNLLLLNLFNRRQ